MYNQVKSPNFAKENQDKIIMRNPILYLIIIGVCILSSCNMQQRGSGALPKELVQAENIMYENPDSALQILQGMEIPVEEEAHATWALLLTQARYKCFVEQSDSLVNIAHDYFMKGENAQKRALALYHKAVLYKEMNQVDKALPYYLQASEEVKLTEDYRLAYLIHSHIGMLYAYRDLHNYSLAYCEKANQYALLSDDSYYIVESYNCMARTFSAQKDYTKAVEFYNKAIEIGKVHGEKKLVNSAIQEKIGIYIRQDKYEDAQELVKEMDLEMLSKAGFQTIGYLFQKTNQLDSAYFYLNKASESDNIYTQQIAYKILFNLSSQQEDYKKSTEYSVKLWKINDSINKIDRNKALIEMQEKYNQQKVINEKNKAERRGLIILCISIGVIGIIVSFYQWKVLRQNKELEDNRKVLNDLNEQLAENQKKIAENEQRMEMAASVETADMTEELKEKEAAIENMRSQNETLKKKNQELLVKIEQREAILQEKSKETERLNVLVEKNAYLRKREIFLSNQLLKTDEMIIKLKKEPDGFKEYQWEELKEKTDALYDRYTERLLKKVPTLTTHDIHICCLIKLSFSNIAMADILGISPTSVSRQKQRLKERIVQQIGSLGENVLLDIWLKEF